MWQYTALMYSFPNFEPVCYSMSNSYCCFLNTGFSFSTVCCDPHRKSSQWSQCSQWSRSRCFLEFPCFLYDPVLSCLIHVQLFAVLWTIALQVHLSMGFSRQEYWSGLPCPPSGDLPDTGIKPLSLMSPALASRFFITSTTWESLLSNECWQFDLWFLCLF